MGKEIQLIGERLRNSDISVRIPVIDRQTTSEAAPQTGEV
jgi:hypothetical protein